MVDASDVRNEYTFINFSIYAELVESLLSSLDEWEDSSDLLNSAFGEFLTNVDAFLVFANIHLQDIIGEICTNICQGSVLHLMGVLHCT